MEKVIIGVDAGGTKTKICVIKDNLEIVYTHMEECGSPAVLGSKALENIYIGIKKVVNEIKNKFELTAIAMGISGLGVIKNKKEFEEKYSLEFNVPVIMENDAVLALYSIVTDEHEEGVLVLSGTGSAILGIKENSTRLIGGWGHLLTEAGSSYSVVRDLINSIIKDYENNNHISPLGKAFMDELNIQNIEGFKTFVYQNTKKEVASLSKFVSRMANENNQEAIALLEKAGSDLAIDVRNAFKALNLSQNAVIGFRGGFISNLELVQNKLISTLYEFGLNPKVVMGYEDPIYGAYFMVKRAKSK